MAGKNSINITFAKSEKNIKRCFPIMAQLRVNLSEEQFIKQIISQQAKGYMLVYLENNGQIKSLSGFRTSTPFP